MLKMTATVFQTYSSI